MNFLDSSSSSPRKYKISGSSNFSLSISIQGELPYHTSVISINTHSKTNKKDILGATYKWYRFHDSTTYHLPDISSNTYILSPTDIGYSLKAEISSKEEGFEGTSFVEFPIIKLDPATRNTLEGILTAGGSSFPAVLAQHAENPYKDFNILLTSDVLRIVRTSDQKFLKTGYSLSNPRVEIHSKDQSLVCFRFEEEFKEKHELFQGKRELLFKLSSKNSRDLLVLALKCFSIKNFLINSKILASLEAFPEETGETVARSLRDKASKIEGFLEIDAIKQENCMLFARIEAQKREKDCFVEKIRELEQEIVETIDTYTKLIADLRENPAEIVESFSEKSNQLLHKKNSEKFEKELSNLNKTLFKDDAETQILDLSKKLSRISAENCELKSQLVNYRENGDNLQDLRIKLEFLQQENAALRHTQQKFVELQRKYCEFDEKIAKNCRNTEKNSEEIVAENKQLRRKVESLQKELENKGDSRIIEHLTRTNRKFLEENQQLIEEIKRKNDEISMFKPKFL